MSSRGKAVITTLTSVALVAAAGVGYLLFTGNAGNIPFIGGQFEQVTCPLTGEERPNGRVGNRPALGVKVENTEAARPQAGLAQADIVYEEPVEGGLTRFLAIYHCRRADRVGPVRSGRLADPIILTQFGESILAYTGGVERVVNDIAKDPGIQDLNHGDHMDLYHEDPERSAPHHLFVSTPELYAAAELRGGPEQVFPFSEDAPAQGSSQRAHSLELTISFAEQALWRYQPGPGTYQRVDSSGAPVTLEDGATITASNVVVQMVEQFETGIVDSQGTPSPGIRLTGSGTAYVFRDGRAVQGRWVRESEDDATRFLTRSGDEIELAPGTTWVELIPLDGEVSYS